MSCTTSYTGKTGVELADVVTRFGQQYRSQYGNTMMPSHDKALSDIVRCCTEALGGSRYQCDDCQKSFWCYHACRNRSCPKCQGQRTEEWLERREAELLPCSYFHAVATVPSETHGVFRREQKYMYGLLMRAAAEAVKLLCLEKRYLGALPGILAVLHTWTGQMQYHPHVHMLITGGGITPDGMSWSPVRGDYLVPVKLLSRTIARLMREALKKERPDLYSQVPRRTWRREWVSFVKQYGHGNDAVLHYLSRYVQKIAISNSRILSIDATHVTFRFKDRNAECWRTMRLPGVEFLHRFLQHVLPRGFHKVRYYGLWHHSRREQANRVWLLQVMDSPLTYGSLQIADLLEADGQLEQLVDSLLADDSAGEGDDPTCPHCGSGRTRRMETRSPPRVLVT